MNGQDTMMKWETWTQRQLGSFGRVVGGGTPSRSQASYWNGSIPWASVKDFTDDAVFLCETAEHISSEGLASSAATLVPEGTPVLCTRMAVGRCALTTEPTAINQDLKAFLLHDNVDRRFFIRMLRYYGPQLDKVSVGSTVRGITISDLLSLQVDCPIEIPEQQRIAAVLDTIDSAIARTAAVISKLKQIRSGMFHDLLTRGLDEHGQLRDPIANPEQFRDSLLGRVPLEWEVAPLSKFVPSAEYGISSSLGDKGIPILRMNNFADGEAKLDDLKYSSVYIPQNLMLKPGDVLFNRTNSWEHVGRTGIWRGQIAEASFASYLVRLNPKHDLLNAELLNYWLNWAPTQVRIRRYATPAVQQVNINPTNLRMVDAAFPKRLEEQSGIIALIQAENSTILSVKAELTKLQNLKSGLVADLLTGTVRVPEGSDNI